VACDRPLLSVAKLGLVVRKSQLQLPTPALNSPSPDPTEMSYPLCGPTTFKFPDEGKLWIKGCATKEDFTHPAELNSEGQCCLMVGKDGNTTDLTVGCYAGLILFTQNVVRKQGHAVNVQVRAHTTRLHLILTVF
jgi:hypothetical protein